MSTSRGLHGLLGQTLDSVGMNYEGLCPQGPQRTPKRREAPGLPQEPLKPSRTPNNPFTHPEPAN